MRNTQWSFLIVYASLAFLGGGCRQAADGTLEEMIDNRYPIEPTATLNISNRDGSIRVYGAGGDTREVRVNAVKRAYSAERLKAISIQISAKPDSITINTVYPDDPRTGFSDRSGTVDYVIVVPQRMRISELKLENGEVLLEEIRSGEAHAYLGNGRLFAHNCFGNLDLHLKTGNLAIVYEWWEEEEFSIRSTIEDGNAFAYLPSDASFHLIASTATGQIGNDFETQQNRHAEPVRKIDMMVGDGEKTTFQFENQDGNIKISEHNP
ncbi:MAG TPA: hypothetical protein VIU85_09805 [Chthoniobacterales bacterium]